MNNSFCGDDLRFATYFRKNMETMGMPVIPGLFLNVYQAKTIIAELADAVSKYGKEVSLLNVLSRIKVLNSYSKISKELTVLLGGVLASVYIGLLYRKPY